MFALLSLFVNFVKEINKTMRKTRYSDVISKAEVLVNDQNNYTRRGALKSRIQRRIDRMTNRAVFLTQFETPELESVNF
jgi:hypothetical protein